MKTIVLFLKNIFRNQLFLAVFLIAFAVVGFGSVQYLLSEDRQMPESFGRARDTSVTLTADIVSIIDRTSGELETIASEDKQGHFEKALDLVRKNLDLSREAMNKATLLSKELEAMAQGVAVIKPLPAQRVAMAAISSEVTLVSHFISYNDNLNQLLEVLRSKFLGGRGDGTTQLVSNINQEIDAINTSNTQFAQLINQLEGYFK